jgi:hypothetical protein
MIVARQPQEQDMRTNENLIRGLAAATAMGLLLAAGIAAAAGYAVEDARRGPVRGESRNVKGGAELLLPERRISPSLVERLSRRLVDVPLAADADGSVKVSRAEAALFVENAFATPGFASPSADIREAANRQWPDELTVLRDASPTAQRRYRVAIEGEVGARAFKASGEVQFVGAENRKQLEKAIEAALDDAARQISGG